MYTYARYEHKDGCKYPDTIYCTFSNALSAKVTELHLLMR